MTMIEWISDANGNRCSVEYFGSVEAAQRALDSLKRCFDCTNCSGCSGCSDCSGCSGCSDCSGCSGCSDCSGCSRCSDCSGCSRCSRCSDLKGARPVVAANVVPTIPIIANIHQRVLEAIKAEPKQFDMSTWHGVNSCGTTHCRGGMVVHLAGEDGRALEAFHDTPLAAFLIYQASSPDLPVRIPRFYEGNDEAMADIRKMAQLEIAATVGGESNA